MLRTPFLIGAALLTSGAMLVAVGLTQAKDGHKGHSHGHKGHGHHHHHHGHHHGQLHFGLYSGNYGYGSYAYPYSSFYGYDDYIYPRSSFIIRSRPIVTAELPSNNLARMQVLLPEPDAQVWVGGSKTSSKGMTRIFETPELESGKSYTYTIRATFNRGGRTITEERKVDVTGGKVTVVDFASLPPPERVPLPSQPG